VDSLKRVSEARRLSLVVLIPGGSYPSALHMVPASAVSDGRCAVDETAEKDFLVFFELLTGFGRCNY